MPISRQTLNSRLHMVTLTFPDTTDTLMLWFRPEALTPEVQEHLARIQRQKEVRDFQRERARKKALDKGELPPDDTAQDELDRSGYELIISLLARWDLLEADPTEENPHPAVLPITVETLRSLGIPISNRIVEEMWASLRANPTKSVSIVNSLPPMDGREPSRNGSFS